ncbi:MAG: 3-dehydroquinate synthase, partial [Pseudomonadota bacterium]
MNYADTRTEDHATTVAWQRFSVPYEYPVAFTRGLFESGNPLLADTLALREPDKRHRCLVFIDGGLIEAFPDLVASIEGYAEAHSTRMALVAAPVVVPGGEKVKTELTHLEAIQDLIHELKVDRHSYVIMIGGGALLDAVGLAA